jgi:hypothetical protein
MTVAVDTEKSMAEHGKRRKEPFCQVVTDAMCCFRILLSEKVKDHFFSK